MKSSGSDAKNLVKRRDVRLQLFITAEVDDKLEDMCEIMGLSKNELVRHAIGQMLIGYDGAIKAVKEKVDEEMSEKNEG